MIVAMMIFPHSGKTFGCCNSCIKTVYKVLELPSNLPMELENNIQEW